MISLQSRLPTALWFVDFTVQLDFWLDAIATLGLVLSLTVIITGAELGCGCLMMKSSSVSSSLLPLICPPSFPIAGTANMIIMLTLWFLYHSIVNVGQSWYSFGWESQLLETGFLGIFLCPLFKLRCLDSGDEGPSRIFIGVCECKCASVCVCVCVCVRERERERERELLFCCYESHGLFSA